MILSWGIIVIPKNVLTYELCCCILKIQAREWREPSKCKMRYMIACRMHLGQSCQPWCTRWMHQRMLTVNAPCAFPLLATLLSPQYHCRYIVGRLLYGSYCVEINMFCIYDVCNIHYDKATPSNIISGTQTTHLHYFIVPTLEKSTLYNIVLNGWKRLIQWNNLFWDCTFNIAMKPDVLD